METREKIDSKEFTPLEHKGKFYMKKYDEEQERIPKFRDHLEEFESPPKRRKISD